MTASRPLVSVIMPCYNSERFVAQSIQSVLTQTLPDFELIVVDNGSSDHTVELIRSIQDSRIRLLIENRKGVSAARNIGIRSAVGEFIAFLDSDDTWAVTLLQELSTSLLQHEGAVLAYCGWQNSGLPGPRGEPFIPPDYEQSDKAEQLLGNCRWPIHAALSRRSAVLRAGCFDEHYSHAEDFALWLRVCIQGPIVRVPRILAFYHHHGQGQATSHRAKTVLSLYRAQLQFLAQHPDVSARLGAEKIKAITLGTLKAHGFECYWRGDLSAAKEIFRQVLAAGYADWPSLKVMLPSLLPLRIYTRLIRVKEHLHD